MSDVVKSLQAVASPDEERRTLGEVMLFGALFSGFGLLLIWVFDWKLAVGAVLLKIGGGLYKGAAKKLGKLPKTVPNSSQAKGS